MFNPIILLFLSLTLGIGYAASRRIKGKVRNYYVAGRRLPFLIVACTLSAQSVDSNATLGNATFSFHDGFWAGAALPLGLAMALCLTGLFFAERLNAMKLLTLPDFYYQRYGKKVELLASVLTITSFIVLLAGNLSGVALIFSHQFDTPYLTTVFVFSVVVLTYTILGGLIAVAWTDVFHLVLLIVAVPTAFATLLISYGLHPLQSALSAGFRWEPLYEVEQGALVTWAAILALGFGDIVALDFMERIFSAERPATARKACFAAALMTLIIGIPMTLLGMMAAQLFQEEESFAILRLFSEGLPGALGALVLVGIIGASMSTADGAILATSTVAARNLLQRHFPRWVPESKLLQVSRLCAVPVLLSAILIALLNPDPGRLLVLAFDIVFAGCLVPLVFGLHWRRSTAAAALVSMIVASITRLVLHYIMPAEYAGLETLIPPVICCLLFVAISVASRGGGEDQIVGAEVRPR